MRAEEEGEEGEEGKAEVACVQHALEGVQKCCGSRQTHRDHLPGAGQMSRRRRGTLRCHLEAGKSAARYIPRYPSLTQV